jgi:hypothetical protein
MRRDDKPEVRVSGVVELLEAVPYLLGFRPEDSVVLVGLRDGAVFGTARIDIAALNKYELLVERLSDEERWAAQPLPDDDLVDACRALARAGVHEVVGSVWLEGEQWPRLLSTGVRALRLLPREDLARRITEVAAEFGLPISDILLVVDRRCWSYGCEDERCCPPEGTRLNEYSRVAAEATFAGMTVLPNRDTVAAQLDPEPSRDRLAAALAAEERRAVGLLLDEKVRSDDRSVVRALFRAARESCEPRAVPVSEASIVRFGVALERLSVRDAVWVAVDDRRLDGRPLWRQLARQLPSPYDAAPLFLFGWTSWRAGNGMLAGLAAERALASDPGYTAADLLLSTLVMNGVSPLSVPSLRSARRTRRSPARR